MRLKSQQASTRFNEGTAVVTGAAAGIGEGLAVYLGSLGMRVVVADINREAAEQVAQGIRASGGDAEAAGLDVTDYDAMDRLAAHLFERHGSVELLINNAGLESAGFLWEVDPDRWKQVMSVNITGVFHGIRAFMPRMIEAGKPAVVANLASVAALTSTPVQAPYTVTKHAVLSLTESLHQEVSLIGAPIQVSAVLPYSIRSSIFVAASREAPTTNDVANAVFAQMQKDNVAFGRDPVDAAEYMLNQIARGEFWVFSEHEYAPAMASARGQLLSTLSDPQDPREQLSLMGVEVSK
ncbi:SDR family NAD(P)-dependent oxidoreductase [Pseudarthrobacter sp. NPDC058329]|uniref:SDR family NAD(P)-dependent oxidoreductase n=1 Tax=Pseudarthrobacter sp. NPDC058329 TaxID=3346448 RepID=UPI0036D845A9